MKVIGYLDGKPVREGFLQSLRGWLIRLLAGGHLVIVNAQFNADGTIQPKGTP